MMQDRILTCDETEEIRIILKHIHKIKEEAELNKYSGYEDDLSRLVIRYLPMIENSYKNFVERYRGIKNE